MSISVDVVPFGAPGLSLSDKINMHRLRHRAFYSRLGWAVRTSAGLEVDEYDSEGARYLIAREGGELRGCWRLLPTLGGRYMLAQRFTHLLNNPLDAPRDATVWEISRFAAEGTPQECFGFSEMPLQMIRAAVSFARQRGLSHYVAVTTPSIERMLAHVGLPFSHFTGSKPCPKSQAVTLWFAIDDHFERAVDAALLRAASAARRPRAPRAVSRPRFADA